MPEIRNSCYAHEFDSIHAHLNDSLYNELIDSIGWDEEDPLADFETAQGHYSYRKDLTTAENSWLAGGMSGDNPYYAAGMPDRILATILSSTRAFIIGSNLYWYDATGNLYVVEGADCDDFDELVRDPDAAVANNPNITRWLPTPTGVCLNNNGYHHRYNYDPGLFEKDFTWLLKFTVTPWGTTYGGNIATYRRNFWGNWKKYRTSKIMNHYGIIYDGDCNFEKTYNEWFQSRQWYLEQYYNEWGQTLSYKAYEIECDYYVNGVTIPYVTYDLP